MERVHDSRAEARQLIDTVEEALATELLRGAIDLHVHSGPSIMPRQLDHAQAVEAAAAAGMAAILFKDHHYSVAPFLPLLDRIVGDRGVVLYAGLVLNNSVGGLNPYAVDFNVKSGAKLVWMPTAHAANHIRNTHRKKRLATNVQLRPPEAISVLDSRGKLVDPVKEILDIIAEFDCILSSGHLHVSEIWPLFHEASRRGVTQLLVNHPTYGLHCTADDIRELVSMGALIEHSACLYVDSRFNCYSPSELREHIEAGGPDNTSLASDLGQVDNPTPVEGMRQIIRLCLALGFTAEEVKKMVQANPARLLGLPIGFEQGQRAGATAVGGQ